MKEHLPQIIAILAAIAILVGSVLVLLFRAFIEANTALNWYKKQYQAAPRAQRAPRPGICYTILKTILFIK